MKIRHKTPTLISMWMLDVFCCALGCVTLLWLLKTREAGTVIAQNESIQADLKDTRVKLLDAENQAFMLGAQLDETSGYLALMREERDATARQLVLTRKKIEETGSELALARTKIDSDRKAIAALEEKATTTADELAKKRQEIENLTRQAAAAKKSATDLELLMRKQEEARAALAMKLEASDKKVDQLIKMEARARDLERAVKENQTKLDDATAQIIDLRGEKAKLADRINRLQTEAEMRFAGITTTGRRAVFLVDMSGSMDRVDVDTVHPEKWKIVTETVVKMMRSLPNLEQFQVILFSGRVSYAMGKPGEWFDYKKDLSVAAVRKALLETKPAGDTNLYAGIEEAFKFRPKGMDTLFLFSDGLPSSGPPLTSLQEADIQALQKTNPRMADARREAYLGDYILKKLRSDWNASSLRSPKVRINSLGFFYESPNLGAFLWSLSRDNDGNFIGMSSP